MTTIACSSVTMEMSSDLQFTQGNTKWKGKTKIWKFSANNYTYPDCGFMVGFAGTAGEIMEVVDYFANPEGYKKPPLARNTEGVILTEQREIYKFAVDPSKWIRIDSPYAAAGSGTHVALGAMLVGATTKEAVQAAMKVDTYTGFGVKTLKF